jgi:hypothetical protein
MMLIFAKPVRTVSSLVLVVALSLLLSLLLSLAAGCDSKPLIDSERPENAPTDPFGIPTTQDQTKTAQASASSQPNRIELGSMRDDLHRRAEGGDVPSMMVLGRWHESRNTEKDRAEARAWYSRAAASGDPSAQQALHSLDAREQAIAAGMPVAQLGDVGATTKPAEVAKAPATAPTLKPLPADGKFRWSDVLEAVDTTGFITDTMPNYQGQWIGLSTDPEKTITVAAAGKNENDLDGVTAVLRIKNKLDPAGNHRVQQVAILANRVTRDNVNPGEVVDWIAQYLNTGQRSEPIYRNGWRITVSGPAAEGIKDAKEHLGAAVMVEMKR